jgi:DNA-3-methyladenine glycosylase II
MQTAQKSFGSAMHKHAELKTVLLDEAGMLKGVRSLSRKCPHMRRVRTMTGVPLLRRHTSGFEGLARIIVGQQLSLASAEAIWGRMQTAVRPMTARAFLKLSDEQLRAAGLSQGKVRTLRALSEAIAGGLDLDALAHLPEDEVHEALTALPGIGPWSADIYLLFCLGRSDAFAAGDLALQIAARAAMGLEARPSTDELFAIAERWRPWRGVAAHLLWAYYKVDAANVRLLKNA